MSGARFTRLTGGEDIANVTAAPSSDDRFYHSPLHSDPNIDPNPSPDPLDDSNRLYSTSYTPFQLQTGDAQELLEKSTSKATSRISFRRASSAWSNRLVEPVSKFAQPLFLAPWRHEVVGGPARQNTIRQFDRRRQRRRILFNGLLQLALPVVISAVMAGVLYHYSHVISGISRRQKYTFNGLITGLSLCLGFASASGLKNFAILMRWRFLAAKYRSLQDIELIMASHSQMKVLRLLWAGRTPGRWLPNSLQCIAFLYLFTMVGLQVVIAALGLAYSLDPDPGRLLWLPMASATVLDMSSISEYVSATFDIEANAAFTYGLASTPFDVKADLSGGEENFLNTVYWNSSTNAIHYWMTSQSPILPATVTPWTGYDGRVVYADSTCSEYTLTVGAYANFTNVTYECGSGECSWSFPDGDQSRNYLTTTYYSDRNSSCGSRCSTTYVYNIGYDGVGDPNSDYDAVRSQLFECNTTMYDIVGVPNAETTKNVSAYQLGDRQASILAGAIGWNGESVQDLSLQWRNYAGDSRWSWEEEPQNTTTVAKQIATFAVGAVAVMDSDGERVNVTGPSPVSAQQLTVKWWAVIAALAMVPGVQFVLLMAVVLWANNVVIKDDSYLAAARLLRPIVDKLDQSGCALTGDEIAEALGNYRAVYGVRGLGKAAYDPRASESGVLHLDMIEEREGLGQLAEEGWSPRHRMPEGRYDGMDDDCTDETTGFLPDKQSRGHLRRMSV